MSNHMLMNRENDLHNKCEYINTHFNHWDECDFDIIEIENVEYVYMSNAFDVDDNEYIDQIMLPDEIDNLYNAIVNIQNMLNECHLNAFRMNLTIN